MLEFMKYNSIENTYNKDFMDKIKLEGLDSLQYAVQEKVHGANCCLITDGQAVYFAKRSGLVEVGEVFYDYEELLERYKDRAIRMYRRIKEKYADTISISVFGEMFGGKYPHPDVKNDSKVVCIQKGVFYCPNHEFYAFDICIQNSEGRKYLAVYEMNSFFESESFFYAKTLIQGTLEECLSYPNAFQSVISDWLGLPPIEDNICEGVVIRPVEPIYFRNGSRLLLKNKNSRFAEKKSIKKRQPTLFVEPTYSEDLNKLLPIIESYVTENRLDNVVSKIGNVSVPKDFGKLIGLLSKDILDDFLKEYSSDYALLEKSEQKISNRHINKLATELIKKVYMHL
ncbi:MAG: RNA ligase, Rnl2 family [Bacteroidales bacterium 36-12]|jgi:Rnl2 family RNA ligase|nr:MAG: RNA ligase, Rnl2 family [Bacteroidales bacterium 36-12]